MLFCSGICPAALLHRGPLPLYKACASLFNSCQRLCLFSFCLDWTLYLLVVSRTSINQSCVSVFHSRSPPLVAGFKFPSTVIGSLLSYSQALHLHPFAGLDPEPKPKQTRPNRTKPNQSAPQRNSIPIRYLPRPTESRIHRILDLSSTTSIRHQTVQPQHIRLCSTYHPYFDLFSPTPSWARLSPLRNPPALSL